MTFFSLLILFQKIQNGLQGLKGKKTNFPFVEQDRSKKCDCVYFHLAAKHRVHSPREIVKAVCLSVSSRVSSCQPYLPMRLSTSIL